MELDGEECEVRKLDKTGYTFQLERPIPVEVLKGRIVGPAEDPVTAAIQSTDPAAGAYMTPRWRRRDGRPERHDARRSCARASRTRTPAPSPPPEAPRRRKNPNTR